MVASQSPVTWLLQRVDGKDQAYRSVFIFLAMRSPPDSGMLLQKDFLAWREPIVISRGWNTRGQGSSLLALRLTPYLCLYALIFYLFLQVQLKRTDAEDERQLWKLIPCGRISPQQEQADRRSLPPQVIDTVITLEGKSKTVRTTTTVTTITTVTEVPCNHCPS